MSQLALSITDFRAQFAEFASTTTYPDSTITMYWDTSILYVSNGDYGLLSGASRQRAIYLFMAHLIKLGENIASNEVPNMISGATIGGESVTLVPPPLKSQFQWWLNLTIYGQQLNVLLSLKAVGGISVGGLPENSAFRKFGGIF